MLAPDQTLSATTKIYLCTGHTDMRKGISGLSLLAESSGSQSLSSGTLFVFRGKSADKLKILWWDGQGFCLFYKRFERGKFVWPQGGHGSVLGITKAQLSMLIEGIDWRMPQWTQAPEHMA